ncbi:HEPN domain-containing protein [Patescibacteria group bacterium]|nr:HEPN domain-containing protein [Patescibacteria group bacterium]MCG2809429.1 HEPN domain-containing protein [Candidatus Portnoybacteria bacterium]
MIQSFDDCLKKGKIKRFSRGKSLAKKELRIAKDDLKSARKSFSDKNYRWCIIQVYYSMFHSARSLLYFKNFREHSHYCLNQAIRKLYVEQGEIDVFFVEALSEAKNLREAADYYGDYSGANAKKLLKKAEKFIEKAEEIILKK